MPPAGRPTAAAVITARGSRIGKVAVPQLGASPRPDPVHCRGGGRRGCIPMSCSGPRIAGGAVGRVLQAVVPGLVWLGWVFTWTVGMGRGGVDFAH